MLPSFKVDFEENKSIDIPEDVYQVELLDIEMKEAVDKETKETYNVLSFQFVIVEEGKYRGYSLWRNWVPTTLYIGKKGKNALFQIIEAMIGRDLTTEEYHTMDSNKINSLVGFQCRVTTKKTEDGKYTNIVSFLAKKASLKALTPAEKEKATFKGKVTAEKVASTLGGTIVKDEEIPVIQIDEEKDMTMHQGDNMTDSNGVRLEDVPF